MRSQCSPHLSISSKQIQQALSVTLALMITLLAGQLYQRWHEAHQAPVQTAISYPHFNAVSSNPAPMSQNQALLQRAESSDQTVRSQSWVF